MTAEWLHSSEGQKFVHSSLICLYWWFCFPAALASMRFFLEWALLSGQTIVTTLGVCNLGALCLDLSGCLWQHGGALFISPLHFVSWLGLQEAKAWNPCSEVSYFSGSSFLILPFFLCILLIRAKAASFWLLAWFFRTGSYYGPLASLFHI